MIDDLVYEGYMKLYIFSFFAENLGVYAISSQSYFVNTNITKNDIFMQFLDTNSHLKTKPYNFDIRCQCNSKSYPQYFFCCCTKFRKGISFFLMAAGFFLNKREYFGADWLDLLISNCDCDKVKSKLLLKYAV